MADTSHYSDSASEIKPGKTVNRSFGLTAQQRALLNFIEAFSATRGIMPSFQEMCDALGLRSKSGIHRLICALERKGHINRQLGSARSISLPGIEDTSTMKALETVLARLRMTRETTEELQFMLDLERKVAGVPAP